jgi:exodeoxyribonuclease-3
VKLATYNVNGVNGRLETLRRWPEEASHEVVCNQELKAPQEKFPIKDIETPRIGHRLSVLGRNQRTSRGFR